MEIPNQKQVWNSIAEEWNKYREEPIKEVSEFLKKQKGNILDLGSGSGRHLTKIKQGKMYLVDFSEKMIQLAKEKSEKQKIPAEFFVSDATKLPFKDNFFDSAIAIASIHCIEKENARQKALKELYRVLKPKAEIFVSVWSKKSKWFQNRLKETIINWKEKGKRYYYIYDPEEIYELFEKIGFRITKKIPSKENILFIAEKI